MTANSRVISIDDVFDGIRDNGFNGNGLLKKMHSKVKDIDIEEHRGNVYNDLYEVLPSLILEGNLISRESLVKSFPLHSPEGVLEQTMLFGLYLSAAHPEKNWWNRVLDKKIRTDVIKYSLRTHQLDILLNTLTRKYCADSCSSGSVGCCNANFYHVRTDHKEYFEGLQEIEGDLGKRLKKSYQEHCRYHSDKGCKLTIMKSPICILSLCNSLGNHLQSSYGNNGKEFWDVMFGEIYDRPRGKKELIKNFDRVDDVIFTGVKLVLEHFPDSQIHQILSDNQTLDY